MLIEENTSSLPIYIPVLPVCSFHRFLVSKDKAVLFLPLDRNSATERYLEAQQKKMRDDAWNLFGFNGEQSRHWAHGKCTKIVLCSQNRTYTTSFVEEQKHGISKHYGSHLPSVRCKFIASNIDSNGRMKYFQGSLSPLWKVMYVITNPQKPEGDSLVIKHQIIKWENSLTIISLSSLSTNMSSKVWPI